MICFSDKLSKPVFQHLIPVLETTGKFLGYVQTSYSMFIQPGKYVLWKDGPAITLTAVKYTRSVTFNLAVTEYLAIVYPSWSSRERFSLKNFISVETLQHQYATFWTMMKSGPMKYASLALFKPIITGQWDTSEDFENAHLPNKDYQGGSIENQKSSKDLCWSLRLSVDRFANAYDFVQADILKLFHSSLKKRGLEDVPQSAEIIDYPETTSLKVTLLSPVMQADVEAKYIQSTMPSDLQIMRLKDLQPGVHRFTLKIESKETVYNITCALILEPHKEQEN